MHEMTWERHINSQKFDINNSSCLKEDLRQVIRVLRNPKIHRSCIALLLRCCVVVASRSLALALWGTVAEAAAPVDYVEGDALIVFKQGASEVKVQQSKARHNLDTVRKYAAISRQHRRDHCHVRSATQTTAALIAALRNDPAVEFAEPNYRRRPTGMITPGDPDFSKLWALSNTGQRVNGTLGTAGADVRFLEAWGMAKPSSAEIVVAVIDLGIDLGHPDLAANVWTNPGEIAGDGLDNDGNGVVDDVHGYDFADHDADPSDADLHGTHVSGIIAAAANNSIGITGAAFKTHIMALKVSSDGIYMNDDAIIAAIDYAVMMKGRGVNIVAINASFGGGSSSTIESNAIQAAGNAGIVFCAAAGNDGLDNTATPFYPASYRLPNMLVVAASDSNNKLASFSNFGSRVDLAAPGTDVYSTIPTWLGVTSASLARGATSYAATALTYSGVTSGITGTLYHCGLGGTGEFPAAVSGNIALIQRGTLTFAEKVTNAMNAGAKAAILYNNSSTSASTGWTLVSPGNWIPALAISKASGQALEAALPASVTLSNIASAASIYDYLEGTSMATPYVSAAIVFAAQNFPDETSTQRVARILNGVTPVASLTEMVASGGVLNLARIVDPGGNGIPDWWEMDYFGFVGIDPGADPDGDGFTNLEEYLIGTHPNNPAGKLAVSKALVVQSGSNQDFRITFPTAVGVTYRVEFSDSLAADSWEALGSDISGTGDPATASDAAAVTLHPQRFYRVRILSP